jgi:CheY-like chemotaxis protein
LSQVNGDFDDPEPAAIAFPLGCIQIDKRPEEKEPSALIAVEFVSAGPPAIAPQNWFIGSWFVTNVQLERQMTSNIAVLLVEDEALVRMDIADQLTAEGYEVFEAASADSAIGVLETEPSIRILFTDIDMPGSMDGLELAAAVHQAWPPLKIAVTSGHHLVGIADIPDGSVFHPKPYEHDIVVASFRALLA